MPTDFPSYGLFTGADYLEPLELSGCAAPDTGWTPAHLQLDGGLRAPAYLKTDSWGEFVFDFQIAQAYAQLRLRYYPKLVCAVPFTPVPGPRLLAPDADGRRRLAAALVERAQAQRCSGAHILFLPEAEARELPEGWLRREQLRYVWRNTGASSFDGFLDALPGKQRKNIRRERRRVAESGLDICWQAAPEIAEDDWPRLYELYASTYERRGQRPYLNLDCLRMWAQRLGARLQFCVARERGRPVALAFFFEDGGSLCGRHWGADGFHDGLHFELCYYRGIERCLERGIGHFDAGVQGEHKLARGFHAERAHSAHWFIEERLRGAIADFFDRERAAIDEALAARGTRDD